MQNLNEVCLIPARSRSKRLSEKNIRMIHGYPLLAHTRYVFGERSIIGKRIKAFETNYPEGVDLDSEQDWKIFMDILESHPNCLPSIEVSPFESRIGHKTFKTTESNNG